MFNPSNPENITFKTLKHGPLLSVNYIFMNYNEYR